MMDGDALLQPQVLTHRPSPWAYMAQALLPSPRLARNGTVPDLAARWLGAQIDRRRLKTFCALTGLATDNGVPSLFLHVLSFPLLMSLITRRAWPLPIWHALQIRNHFLRHRVIGESERFDIDLRVAGQRILERGIEVDLHTTFTAAGACAWDSLVTFYYRGRYGTPGARSVLAQSPETPQAEVARWQAPTRGGLRLGWLSGDYNGIHWSRHYARFFGFANAFLHPQRSAGMALARLGRSTGERERLDLWLKGPVYYGRTLRLHADDAEGGTNFSLLMDGEPRPCIVGRRSDGPLHF